MIGDPDALDELGVRMREQFDGRLWVTKSLPFFLEFADEGVSKASGLGFLAERLGFSRERTVAFGDGENDLDLVEWGGFGVAVENADPRSEGARRLGLPAGGGRGRRSGDRSGSRLKGMIDLRAARADPDRFRAALARKGAAERFDALLAADERWRAVLPQVEELRTKLKLKGKPTPEQLEELNQVKEELETAEEELAAAEAERDALLDQVPNPPDPSAPDGDDRRGRRGDPPGRRAGPARARSTPRSAASRWSAPRGSRARASATSPATRRSSRWRSTASRSTAPPRTATRR